MTRKERATALVRALRQTYPDAHCELDFSNPLELLVATVLSAQCTDMRVNQVTPGLFARYPAASDYANAPEGELEAMIHSTGFFRNKARHIRGAAKAIEEQHGGRVPSTMEDLTALPGVGRKTANVVMGNAFGLEEGIVVDTHVARLSRRLRLTRHEDPVKIEGDLMKVVSREVWTLFSHWLIWHGRRRCMARKPDCVRCEIRELCPTAGKHGRQAKARKPLDL